MSLDNLKEMMKNEGFSPIESEDFEEMEQKETNKVMELQGNELKERVKLEILDNEEIFSKVLRAGRRTYFFDVRATRANDYYLTITESKKFTHDDGSFHYKKHKIYLYKEDFEMFKDILNEMTNYVFDEKGEEVISERHQKDFKKNYYNERLEGVSNSNGVYKDLDFEDL